MLASVEAPKESPYFQRAISIPRKHEWTLLSPKLRRQNDFVRLEEKFLLKLKVTVGQAMFMTLLLIHQVLRFMVPV